MKTITLTEFNQNPSRATRMAETDDVLVLRRGVAAYRLERVRSESSDPVEGMVEAGLLSSRRRVEARRGRRFPVATSSTDLGALLDDDRDRLDD